MNSILGGKPLRVIVRLVVLSIVVGTILAWLELSPFALLDYAREVALRIYRMGFDAFGWVFRYFLLGAVIVIPVWLIGRFWHLMTQGGNDRR